MKDHVIKYDLKAVLTHLWPVHTEREYEDAVFDDRVQIAKAFKSYQV